MAGPDDRDDLPVAPGEAESQVSHDPFAGTAIAAAPRRGLIKVEDLDQVIPVATRRVGTYQSGAGTRPVEGGLDWDDLDLTKKGDGIKSSKEELQQAWDEAREHVSNWSPEQKAALDQYFADHPEVGPGDHDFWDRALKLPDLARYWYEVSTRGMQHEGLDRAPPEDAKLSFRVAGATSPLANPTQNIRRTLGVLAEHYQGLPSAMDLTTPGSVQKAFGPGLAGAPKIGNFSGTFEHIAGLTDKAPISVNDRQVGAIHNIDPEEFASNPGLYAMVSKFYQNFRDLENSHRPGVAAGIENPYESWQLQAPGWVQVRGEAPGARGERTAQESGYDDYAQVIKREKERMEAAGIDTSPGIFSPEVLKHPEVPNLMSGTRQRFLDSPIATMETFSKLHPEGQRAADLMTKLRAIEPAGWTRNAQADMEALQRRAMRKLSTGGRNSILSKMVSAAVGAPAEVSRVDTTGFGQFEGETSPNLRIPMWARVPVKDSEANQLVTLNPNEILPVLSGLGHDFEQKAQAASHFRTIDPSEDPLVMPKTYSVWLPERDRPPTPVDQLHAFGNELGLPLNIARGPTGTLADINVGGFEDRMPTLEQVDAAAARAFGDAPFGTIARDYDSHYLTHPAHTEEGSPSYDTHLQDFADRLHAEDLSPRTNDPRGIRRANWDAARRLGDFEAARVRARQVAAEQKADIKAWLDKYAARIENPPKPRRVAQAGPGAAIAAAQAPQPPPPETPQPLMAAQ